VITSSDSARLGNLDDTAAHRTKVRIAKPTPNAMQCAKMHAYNYWELTNLEQGDRWSNQVMGYYSNSDPNSNLKLRFDTAEEAVRYAKRMGWEVQVDPVTTEPASFHGKKNYDQNFLLQRDNAELRRNEAEQLPQRSAKSLYKYSKGRESAHWVNLKRSPYAHESDWKDNI